MDAIYRVEGSRVITSPNAAGPWDPGMQHGSAPASLVVWAAESIATTLHLPPTAVKPLTAAVPVANVVGSGVVVVIGADLAPVSGSTTTTAAPVTTTTAAHSTTSTTKK